MGEAWGQTDWRERALHAETERDRLEAALRIIWGLADKDSIARDVIATECPDLHAALAREDEGE